MQPAELHASNQLVDCNLMSQGVYPLDISSADSSE